MDSQAVCSLLDLHSTRVAKKVLELWRKRLNWRERSLLMYNSQGAEPDQSDPFPDVDITLQFGDLDVSPLKDPKTLSLHAVDGMRQSTQCVD